MKARGFNPTNYTIPDTLVPFLKRNLKGFKDYSGDIQARIAFWLLIAGINRRKHKRDPSFMSMSYQELESFFGRGKFSKINQHLQIFDVIHSSPNKKQTQGYRLTEAMQRLKEEYLVQEKPQEIRRMDMNGRVVRKLPKTISSLTIDGSRAIAWEEIIRAKLIPGNGVPVNLMEMKRLLDHLEHRLTIVSEHEISNIKYYIQILRILLLYTYVDVAGRNIMPHRYREGATGRLFAAGGGISLQTTPRFIRIAALHGSYDYDIENCHFAIFCQLAAIYGYDCKAIKNYLAHKSEIRQGIAERVGITVDQAKRVLLALMFGARVNGWEFNSIPELLGKEKADKLFKDAQFIAIAKDVKQGRNLILDRWPNRDKSRIINAVGKARDIKAHPSIRLAHIIQGIEAQALMAAILLYPNDITLLMHDGFASSISLDTIKIEEAIKEATGMELKISVKEVELPSNLDLFLDDYLQG